MILVEERILEGAKQGTRFWLSLCKHGDCFIDSSFLAGKEANGAVAVDKSGQKIERGKNQCPGAGRRGRRKQGPESAAATGCPLSTSDGVKQRGRSTEENTRGRRHEKGIKRGRAGQRAQPAPLGRPHSIGRVSTSGRVLCGRHRAGDVPPSRYCCVGVVLGKVSVSSEVLVFG